MKSGITSGCNPPCEAVGFIQHLPLVFQTHRMLPSQATIEAERVILKIDIEGYECKALPEEIIMGSSGKRIPFIFLEWGQLVVDVQTALEQK